MTETVRSYIGIGGNLEDPIARVRAGIEQLRGIADSRVVACSSLYRTAPVGVEDQPDFVNAVCALETRLRPEALLQALFAIEQRHGRVRGPIHGGPRTLDLDILLYGELQLVSEQITLPHPRLHERAFVLVPLLEIAAPSLCVPGGETLAVYRHRCRAQVVTRIIETEAIAR